jgi:hypothetical protein
MATLPRVPTHSAVQGPITNRGGGLARARGIARLLDDLIRVPGTNIGIGLDPIIGLIPGVGDIVGGVMSSYILLVAMQEGAPTSVLARMLGNIALDSIVGIVPVVGDLFDVGVKSNRRNVDLLERYLGAPKQTKAASRGVVALILLGLVLLIVGVVAAGVLVVKLLGRMLG